MEFRYLIFYNYFTGGSSVTSKGHSVVTSEKVLDEKELNNILDRIKKEIGAVGRMTLTGVNLLHDPRIDLILNHYLSNLDEEM